MNTINSIEQQRRSVKRPILHVLKIGLASVLLLVVIAGGLLAYYVYSPDVVEPLLSGSATRGAINVSGTEAKLSSLRRREVCRRRRP